MITEIYIHDYKCLKNIHIQNIDVINVLIGSNGSGKTAFLEMFASKLQRDEYAVINNTSIDDIITLYTLIILHKNLEYEFINVMRSFEPELLNIQYINNTLIFKYYDDRICALECQGSGLLRILEIILTLYNNQNKYIFIEYCERSIHYQNVKVLAKLIIQFQIKYGFQLFITTFNREFCEIVAEVTEDYDHISIISFKRENTNNSFIRVGKLNDLLFY